MNRADVLPRYLEIQRDLQTRISTGDWPPGHRIAAEHELQKQYGCSRMTVNKALSALVAMGMVTRKRRFGSFVAMPKSQQSVLEIPDIKAEITSMGHPYRFEIVARTQREATVQDADRLDAPVRTAVLVLDLVHLAGNEPYASEERLINLTVVPEAANEPFTADPPGTWLLNLIPWTEAEHTIRAEQAGAGLARRLAVAKGAACLVVERRTWQAGRSITWVSLSYPGERHRLVSRFSPGKG